MNKNQPKFEGFKGEVYKAIHESGPDGITFKALQSRYVSTLLDEAVAHGKSTTPNLHATLLMLTNGGHVKSSPVRSAVFQETDVFKVG
ncbi:MAG: hypothetical protein QG669_231 [Patescibacteria group bacterium]|nr:hypothetical protein [Patescibacteria group bacterium]